VTTINAMNRRPVWLSKPKFISFSSLTMMLLSLGAFV
jgi:hypothetical protein